MKSLVVLTCTTFFVGVSGEAAACDEATTCARASSLLQFKRHHSAEKGEFAEEERIMALHLLQYAAGSNLKVAAGDVDAGAELDLCAGGAVQVPSKLSADIPLVKTPNDGGRCGFQTYPPPVLAECTEPLPPGVPDIRGFWTGFMGKHVTMRHEQCGDRVAVVGESHGFYVMRDLLHVDGTYEHGINDYTAEAIPECAPLVAAGVFQGNCLHFLLQNMGGGISVSRCAQPNGTMVFDPTGMGGQGGYIFIRAKTTTVTCQQLQDFYQANECADMPDKIAKQDMGSFSLCDFVHNSVTCGDIKYHYTANMCCGSPQKIVNKPAWCSYTPA